MKKGVSPITLAPGSPVSPCSPELPCLPCKQDSIRVINRWQQHDATSVHYKEK